MQTLLLADDNAAIQRFVEVTFSDRDVRVVVVADGEAALQRLLMEPPDLVLAALTLGKVSGYDLARFVRQTPGLQNVPVLLMAGALDPVDEPRLRDAGVAGVLIKPFEPDIVIDRVMALLRPRSQEQEMKDTAAGSESEFTVIGRPRMWEPGVPAPVSADAAAPWRGADGPDPQVQLDAALTGLAAHLASETPGPDMPAGADATAVLTATATFPADSTTFMHDDRSTESSAAGSTLDGAPAAAAEWPDTTTFGAAASPLAPPVSIATSAPIPPSAPANGVADAFAALLAEEQGEVMAPPAPASEGDFSDAALDRLADRLALRVADRVAHGLGSELRRIVSDVAERLVREEIARLRRRS